MIHIEPTGQVLGATVTGVDLKQHLSNGDLGAIMRALGDCGVLRFPSQILDAKQLRDFSARFGEIQILSASKYVEPGVPEVTILSNIVQDGKPIGSADAGQFWHTDMTYNAGHRVGFVNVLVAHEVPTRDGKPLGATEFTNTQAAYIDLPEDLKRRFADATATHDINKQWEWLVNVKKSPRAPLTQQERNERPPVSHPVFLTHPISGRKVIYVNPSYVTKIDGYSEQESARILEPIFEHILQPKYRYLNHWTLGDVLVWDHLGTWHNAVADYGPSEHRLMKRCQVMADRVFDKAFIKDTLAVQ